MFKNIIFVLVIASVAIAASTDTTTPSTETDDATTQAAAAPGGGMFSILGAPRTIISNTYNGVKNFAKPLPGKAIETTKVAAKKVGSWLNMYADSVKKTGQTATTVSKDVAEQGVAGASKIVTEGVENLKDAGKKPEEEVAEDKAEEEVSEDEAEETTNEQPEEQTEAQTTETEEATEETTTAEAQNTTTEEANDKPTGVGSSLPAAADKN